MPDSAWCEVAAVNPVVDPISKSNAPVTGLYVASETDLFVVPTVIASHFLVPLKLWVPIEFTNLCLFVATLALIIASVPPPPPDPTLMVTVLFVTPSIPNVCPAAGSVERGYEWILSWSSLEQVKFRDSVATVLYLMLLWLQ